MGEAWLNRHRQQTSGLHRVPLVQRKSLAMSERVLCRAAVSPDALSAFCDDLVKRSVACTKSASSLPTRESVPLHAAEKLGTAMDGLRRRAHLLMTQLVPEAEGEDDCISAALERIDTILDELRRGKAGPAPTLVRPAGPVLGPQTWGAGVAKPRFADVDNSNTRFRPKIASKPFSAVPLPDFAAVIESRSHQDRLVSLRDFWDKKPEFFEEMPFEDEDRLRLSPLEHPYEREIADLMPKGCGSSAAAGDETPLHALFSVFSAVQPMDGTPVVWVDTVQSLKSLAAELEAPPGQAIAVDLEAHSYHSFQGFVCLMQLSTATRDYLVDTIALRVHVGPALAPCFANPSIIKVFHGADSDIVWLQRDFGIYVVNMFDTGQASRVLGRPSHGYAACLQHYCDISTDKKYQRADWRIRPLSQDMALYARCDTHYLLHIFYRMVLEAHQRHCLEEVWTRSKAVCLRLYEKELLFSCTAGNLFRKHASPAAWRSLSLKQKSVFKFLVAWRDSVARTDDESSSAACGTAAIVEIAKHCPMTTSLLFQCVETVQPRIPFLVRRDADVLLKGILFVLSEETPQVAVSRQPRIAGRQAAEPMAAVQAPVTLQAGMSAARAIPPEIVSDVFVQGSLLLQGRAEMFRIRPVAKREVLDVHWIPSIKTRPATDAEHSRIVLRSGGLVSAAERSEAAASSSLDASVDQQLSAASASSFTALSNRFEIFSHKSRKRSATEGFAAVAAPEGVVQSSEGQQEPAAAKKPRIGSSSDVSVDSPSVETAKPSLANRVEQQATQDSHRASERETAQRGGKQAFKVREHANSRKASSTRFGWKSRMSHK